MLQVFLEESGVEACNCIRLVICSGEALSHELQKRFFERLGAELHNLYGPTEAAVDVTYWACQRNNERLVVPIGRPVANTQIYILDSRMQPVPVGVTGELYIGGVQVARGYLNRQALTAERFVKDSFSGVPGARLYRTGDLARYLPDGAIEYLGRVDFQVKIRGLRVELGEIEAHVEEFEWIGRCAVTLREDVAGDKRLVAYYQRRQDREVNQENLKGWLRQRLPSHMVPQHFVELGQIPLTASGKVDRKALPTPKPSEGHENFIAPRNRIELEVVKIWQELLGTKKVGLKDNFFDLGGHSLLIIRMVGRLNQIFSRPLTVVDVFRAPTIEGLAAMLAGEATNDVISPKTYDLGIKQRQATIKRRPAGTSIKR
jgi:acyl carrier protein